MNKLSVTQFKSMENSWYKNTDVSNEHGIDNDASNADC